LNKLPLEDEGGEGTMGAHWERKTFGNELMTGS
jgi:Leishmanolysin